METSKFIFRHPIFETLKHGSAKTLLKNASWLTAGQGLSVFSQAAYFFCLARLLGTTEYGIYVGAFSLTAILAQYSSIGSGTIFIRYVAGMPSRFSSYWGNILVITLVVGTAMSIALHFIGRAFLNPQSAALVAIAAVSNCVCLQLTSECSRVFQTFGKMRWTAVLQFLSNLARAIVASGMLAILRHATAWQWSAASLVISGLTAVASIALVCGNLGFPGSPGKLMFSHAREGFGYSFAMSTSAVYNDLDKTLLSHFRLNAANGIYAMAYRAIDVATIPLFAIREAVLPRLFEVGRDGISQSAIFCFKLLNRSFPIAICASLGLFFSAPLVPRFLGPGFVDSVAAIRWLCLIPALRSVHQMTGAALTGAGRQGWRTAAQSSTAGLNLALNLWLIPNYGWRGAAWSSVAADGFLAVACWVIVLYLIGRERAKNNRSCDDRLHVFCGDD